MKIRPAFGKFHEISVDALVISFFEGETTEEGLWREIDQRTGGVISALIASEELRGKAGETVYIHNPAGLKARRLLLIGAGKREDSSLDTVRQEGGIAARFLRARGVKSAALLRRSDLHLEKSAQAAVEGALLALFDPGTYRTKEKEERFIEELVLLAETGKEEEIERGIEQGTILAKATNFARNLVNEPSSVLTPTVMAKRAEEMATRYGLDLDVLDEQQMKELDMGALLGVARGSDEPARLIVLRYVPEGEQAATNNRELVALVGKGITFDSGGISLKPADGMERMKYDMAGGAAVMGAMRAIAQLRPAINVIGIVPATENMPSGRAQKPGDVIRSMSGKTIEVINTDAEGRLVLADALHYARGRRVSHLVDVATLTGACVVALGTVNSGAFTNNQPLLDKVVAAGKAAGEKIWPLPMDVEYEELIKSDIAEIKNTGGRKGGAITGAKFLQRFVGDTPWVHLDIAGTFETDKEKGYQAKGGTGVMVRTLVNLAVELLSH
jgi:leucyl aminopeptidase